MEWLKDLFGTFGNGSMTEPMIGRCVNGNNEKYLSVDCTMGHLLQNEQARAIVGAVLAQGGQTEGNSQAQDSGMAAAMSPEAMQAMMEKMTLRDLLAYGQAPDEVIGQLNGQLGGIMNL